MANNEIIRAVLEYVIPGASQVLNVFYWLQNGNAQDEDVADDLFAWAVDSWGDRWASLADDSAELTLVSVDAMNPDGTVKRKLGTDVVSVIGNLIGDNLAGGVSAMLFAPTVLPRTRGRKYVAGLSESGSSGGFWTGNTLADLAVLALPYISDFIGVSGTIYEPGVISTVTLDYEPFLQTVGFDDIPDYIRNRKPNEGS